MNTSDSRVRWRAPAERWSATALLQRKGPLHQIRNGQRCHQTYWNIIKRKLVVFRTTGTNWNISLECTKFFATWSCDSELDYGKVQIWKRLLGKGVPVTWMAWDCLAFWSLWSVYQIQTIFIPSAYVWLPAITVQLTSKLELSERYLIVDSPRVILAWSWAGHVGRTTSGIIFWGKLLQMENSNAEGKCCKMETVLKPLPCIVSKMKDNFLLPKFQGQRYFVMRNQDDMKVLCNF
jgi:hypothetical protein